VAKKDETVDQEHAWSMSVRTASTYIEARMLFSLDTRRAVFQIVAHTVHDGYRSACDVFETSEPSGERYCCQDLFEKLACLLDYRGWHFNDMSRQVAEHNSFQMAMDFDCF
jgi:hypothetical protein